MEESDDVLPIRDENKGTMLIYVKTAIDPFNK